MAPETSWSSALRKARQRHKHSQSDLGKALGVTGQMAGRYERGKDVPTPRIIEQAKAYIKSPEHAVTPKMLIRAMEQYSHNLGQAAKACGVHVGTVSKWRAGRKPLANNAARLKRYVAPACPEVGSWSND